MGCFCCFQLHFFSTLKDRIGKVYKIEEKRLFYIYLLKIWLWKNEWNHKGVIIYWKKTLPSDRSNNLLGKIHSPLIKSRSYKNKGELLFPWWIHIFPGNYYSGSPFFPGNFNSGSNFFRGVKIYGYTGMCMIALVTLKTMLKLKMFAPYRISNKWVLNLL